MKWQTVILYSSKFEATKKGMVRHYGTKQAIKTYNRKDSGYEYFRFENKTIYIHRCVLSAFNHIEGCEKLYVNHKDFNPSNNNFSNLEWCTQDYNMKYGIPFGRYNHSADVARKIGLQKAKEGKLEFHTNMTPEQHRQRYEKRSLNYKINGHPFKGQTGFNGKNVKMTIEKLELIKNMFANKKKIREVMEATGFSKSTVLGVKYGTKKY